MRDARQGRRGASHRLRERVAGRRVDVAALLLPVGDEDAGEVVRVLRRDRAAHAHLAEHARLLRGRRPRRPAYEEKLAEYRKLADTFLQVAEYEEFCAKHLANVDEIALEYFASPEFDGLLVATVTSLFPAHEHEAMVERHRGLVGAWVGPALARSPRAAAVARHPPNGARSRVRPPSAVRATTATGGGTAAAKPTVQAAIVAVGG